MIFDRGMRRIVQESQNGAHTSAVLSGICVGMRVNPESDQQAAPMKAGTIERPGVLHETATAPTTPATKKTPVYTSLRKKLRT